MGHKNAFLRRMQANHEREAKTGIMLAEKWTRQAACDALVLLFGYGECMGGTKWGKETDPAGGGRVDGAVFVGTEGAAGSAGL